MNLYFYTKYIGKYRSRIPTQINAGGSDGALHIYGFNDVAETGVSYIV